MSLFQNIRVENRYNVRNNIEYITSKLTLETRIHLKNLLELHEPFTHKHVNSSYDKYK